MCIQIYNPIFRAHSQSDVLKSVNFNHEWRPYGYKYMKFNKSISTVFVSRERIKNTIYDI